jgi:hypothetical protein
VTADTKLQMCGAVAAPAPGQLIACESGVKVQGVDPSEGWQHIAFMHCGGAAVLWISGLEQRSHIGAAPGAGNCGAGCVRMFFVVLAPLVPLPCVVGA